MHNHKTYKLLFMRVNMQRNHWKDIGKIMSIYCRVYTTVYNNKHLVPQIKILVG